MRWTLLLLAFAFAGATASAQDSSFSRLRFGGSVFRLPEIGHLADDWRATTGIQLEATSNVGAGYIALSIGRIAFEPRADHPAFAETHFALTFMRPIYEIGRLGFSAGARLTDVRMDFDDPAIVEGLRTEGEVIVSVLGRGHIELGRGTRGFVEGAYGRLMLSTRTPTALVAAGLEHGIGTPGWLREILR